MLRKFFYLSMTLVMVLASGCATTERVQAVPESQTNHAEIPGIPGVRYWVATDIEPYVRDTFKSIEREKAALAAAGHSGDLPPANFLAISGGGDAGAFGAGLLVGWTKAGNRPMFKVVTGVSTGALIAPFAFLGPEYDGVLSTVYTTIGPKNVLDPRNILLALTSDAMADNRPLLDLITKYITADILAKIAREYERGRILLIGTANLDARQPVIWNMGAIAASKDPNALDLFRHVLLASAAIPGATGGSI